VPTTLDYDSLGCITRRTTARGYSDYTYEDGTNWLVRETWHSAISGNVFDLVRYWYTNGRPSRVELVMSAPGDLSTAWSYGTYYIQYNWHGDAVTYVALDGSGGGSWGAYDPWGNPSSWPPPSVGYYRWNGAWGYLRFDALGLYYVHGRWYNPDTGLFLSPDANGEYRYGSGQDAVNWAWGNPSDIKLLTLLQQQRRIGISRSLLLHLVEFEQEYIRGGGDPADLAYIPQFIGALMAVGEMEEYCSFKDPAKPRDDELRNCQNALGAALRTVRNRYLCNQNPRACNNQRYLGGTSLSGIMIVTGTYTIRCGGRSYRLEGGFSAYQGLERWIGESPCFNLSLDDPVTYQRYQIALTVGRYILGDTYRTRLIRILGMSWESGREAAWEWVPPRPDEQWGNDIGSRTMFIAGTCNPLTDPLSCLNPAYARTTKFWGP
jgi:RHS repeat-associated protein